MKEASKIIVDREGAALDEIKKSLDVDNLRLIPVYWLLFVCIAVLLAWRNISWATWLAVAAGLSITAAAGFDYLENLRTLEVVRALLDKSASDELVSSMRFASLAKWSFFFATTAAFSS